MCKCKAAACHPLFDLLQLYFGLLWFKLFELYLMFANFARNII